jgi:hypothetical protein
MKPKTFAGKLKGKTVDRIEVSSAPGDAFVAVHFDDKTCFTVDLKPGLILSPELNNWAGDDIEPVTKFPKMVA